MVNRLETSAPFPASRIRSGGVFRPNLPLRKQINLCTVPEGQIGGIRRNSDDSNYRFLSPCGMWMELTKCAATYECGDQ